MIYLINNSDNRSFSQVGLKTEFKICFEYVNIGNNPKTKACLTLPGEKLPNIVLNLNKT